MAGTPENRIYDTQTGAARSWRVLHNGTPLTNPNGSQKAFTRTAALKALERATAADTPVLDTTRPRMDGLTHEEAHARYGDPAPVLCIAQEGGTMTLAIGGSIGTVQLEQGRAVGIEVTRSGVVLYEGTLEDIGQAGSRSRHALALAPWRQITTGTIEAYLVGVGTQGQGAAQAA